MMEAKEKVVEFIHEISSSQGENEYMASTRGLFCTPFISSLSKLPPAPSRTLMGSGLAPQEEDRLSSHCSQQFPPLPAVSCGTRLNYLAGLRASFLIYKMEGGPSVYVVGYLRLNEIIHVSIRNFFQKVHHKH